MSGQPRLILKCSKEEMRRIMEFLSKVTGWSGAKIDHRIIQAAKAMTTDLIRKKLTSSIEAAEIEISDQEMFNLIRQLSDDEFKPLTEL